jgi:hypothetical protein
MIRLSDLYCWAQLDLADPLERLNASGSDKKIPRHQTAIGAALNAIGNRESSHSDGYSPAIPFQVQDSLKIQTV